MNSNGQILEGLLAKPRRLLLLALSFPSIAFAVDLWPLEVGRYWEFESHDGSSPPIKWAMRAEVIDEVTIGAQRYFQLVVCCYEPGSFEQVLFRSTENAVYTYRPGGEQVSFQLAPVGTSWTYYSEINSLPGQTVVEIVNVGPVDVPYGSFPSAYDYRKYWDPDDPSLPNEPPRDEFVVPGVGLVKVIDYWTDTVTAPLVHEVAHTGIVPEPSNLVLLGIGLAGLGFATRRIRR